MMDRNTRATSREITDALACGQICCEPARRKGEGQVHCPAHADTTPSLSVKEKNDVTLVHCFGGCTQEAVLDVLRARGLWPSASVAPIRPSRAPATLGTIYDYRAASGETVYRMVRTPLSGGGKKFGVWRPDGKGGWISGMGSDAERVEVIPYRLPELLAAPADALVFIVEGEKKADRLAALGLVATCNPFGAGKWPKAWGDRYLAGRRVVILGDNDETGRKHVAQVAKSCADHASSIRVIHFAELAEKADVVDWLDAGHDAAALLELVEKAAERAPKPPRPIDLSEVRMTDLGNAARLVRQNLDDLRYVDTYGKGHPWLVWDGKRWKLDDDREVNRRARAAAISIYDEVKAEPTDDKKRAMFTHAIRTSSAARIEAMLSLARSESPFSIRPQELDADLYALNVNNGTIDLRTGILRPHRREDLITKLAPVDYDPDARSELWDQFLYETFGADAALIEFVQMAAGYSLTGETFEQKLMLGVGQGATGKTTLMGTLLAVMGDYALTAEFETFLDMKERSGPRNDLARLHGARLVTAIEAQEGKRLDEGRLKSVTGGEKILARELYGHLFEFKPQFKLWLLTNHAPKVADDDDAIWRRMLRIPFSHPVPKDHQDPELQGRLTNPAGAGPAVLAWAIRGCLRWQANRRDGRGFVVPKIIEATTDAYREDMDVLRDFLEERCETGEGPVYFVPIGELYAVYVLWAKDAGIHWPLDKKRFGKRLDLAGFPADKGTDGVRIRRGLRMAGQARQPEQGEIPV